jgi:hypothetical protein
MDNRMTFAGGVDWPSPILYDAITALQRAAGGTPSGIEALEGQRVSTAVEAAAAKAVLEVLCEQGRSNSVAATLAEFGLVGSPTRAFYLELLRRLAERYVPQG